MQKQDSHSIQNPGSDYVTKEITITLESQRGTSPKSYTKIIEEIINEAK